MIKQTLYTQIAQALQQASPDLNQLVVDEAVLSGIRLERPRNAEHGDYAVNVSFLARHTKMPPPKIAETLEKHFNSADFEVSVIGGYLNFKIAEALLKQALVDLIQNPSPGKNNSMAGERILLEYVSANPTGPLHIGHGRWAALGDALVRLFRYNGAQVTAEFYINDAGVQMFNITTAVQMRAVELLQQEGELASYQPEHSEYPYPGEYVIEIARAFLSDAARRQRFIAGYDGSGAVSMDELRLEVKDFTRNAMLAEQRALLDVMRVTFENWISEKEYLYDAGLIPKTLTRLQDLGYVYSAEDAVWFKSTEFGDEKDRVLQKSDGSYTYLMPDIAYHDEKYHRKNASGQPLFNRIMNIWGADHHGYIPRMRGAIQALGHDPNQFEVLLGQLVNLIVDGEKTRMGKRRKMLTLQDVVDEVGVDATRFWMVSKSADSALDFDVDLAASASNENPVFYVQYAHARCCSIVRNATEPAPNVDTGEQAAPYVTTEELKAYQAKLSAGDLAPLFEALSEAREHEAVKDLLMHLDGFEDLLSDAARLRAPHFLTQYAMELASHFHSFYNACRVLTPQPEVTRARLMLILAIQKVLAQALALLGVTAPQKM